MEEGAEGSRVEDEGGRGESSSKGRVEEWQKVAVVVWNG